MSLIFLIILFAFFLWVLKNTLFWVGIWQDKEYRLDRLLVHFRETQQGKKILFSYGNIIKWLLLASFPLIFIWKIYFVFFTAFSESVILIQACFILNDAFRHRIKRPIFTIKANIIVFITLAVVVLVLPAPVFSFFFILLVIDRMLPLFIAIFVGIFAFPTFIYKEILINKAKKRINYFPKIKIIAVSGSYGKTSTKEYIAQVLAEKYNVVKTPGSNNTSIGIAKTILNNINKDTDIFVVEMGAYKIGEIKELCQIVMPDISVTTAISDQHLSLYGSIENVITSEFELISAVKANGLSLFNDNSKYMDELYKKTLHNRIYYSANKDKINSKSINIYADKIKANLNGINFNVTLGKENLMFSAPILGEHSVQNILPAIYIAKFLGMKNEEIKKRALQLSPPLKTMKKIILKNNSIGIDDTFNASPESVFAAIKYLSLGKNKKYFVFAPLSELGENASIRHKEIGLELGKVCDKVFVLNNNFSNDIGQGIKESGKNCELIFKRADEVIKSLQSILSQEDIVVFEGKESGVVLKKLL